MVEFVVAGISGATALAVAIIEKRTRKDNDKWEQNSSDHKALVDRMESIGHNLGRSLDRVEDNLGQHISRLENKIEQHDEVLFGHLASHAEAALAAQLQPAKRRRGKD